MFGKRKKRGERTGGRERGREGKKDRFMQYRWFYQWRHESTDPSLSRKWVWFCVCLHLEMEKVRNRTEIPIFHTTWLPNASQQLHPMGNEVNSDVSSLEENWLQWSPTRHEPWSWMLHMEGDKGFFTQLTDLNLQPILLLRNYYKF